MSGGQEPMLRRLPGLRHTDHVGLTVPNLEDGIRFFVEVLGAEELYRSERGPDEEHRGVLEAHRHRHRRAEHRGAAPRVGLAREVDEA